MSRFTAAVTCVEGAGVMKMCVRCTTGDLKEYIMDRVQIRMVFTTYYGSWVQP